MLTLPIRLLWHPQAQFAGYLLAERLGLGHERGVAVQCVPMRFDVGPIEAVLSGDVAFAVASPAHMVESGRAGDLTMVLAMQQESALVYAARRAAGVTRVADLEGKRIGVWPGGEDLELRWFLARSGLPPDSYERVPMTDTVAGLVSGAVECAQMTRYHEIHLLEAAEGSLRPFRLFSAEDAGASLLKDGLVARRDFVARNASATQAALEAILDGWTRAFRAREATVAALSAIRPDMTADEHRRQLDDIASLSLCGATSTHGLGYPDPVHMQRALAAVADMDDGVPEDPAGLVDERFWRAAPPELRAREW